MGDGNAWHLQLIRPAMEELLQVRPKQRILDAACGNGLFARRLTDLGASVTAFDVAPAMIERARARSTGYEEIDYRIVDATDREQVRGLGGPFDAVACAMALMDMADIQPLIEETRTQLKRGGAFVFAVQHPCFNSGYSGLVVESSEGDSAVSHSLKLRGYKEPKVSTGEALAGQPALQLYFHRPLEDLFNVFFGAGYVLDGLVEPTFSQPPAEGDRRLRWDNLAGIPPVLVARMRAV